MARSKETERQSKSRQTRQALLEAAAGEFARAGYLGANINTISSTAGYGKGTIYNYFASKQALLLALIQATAQQHLEFIVSQVGIEPDQTRRLELFFEAGFAFVARYGSEAQVLFNTLHDPDQALKAYVFECYQPMFRFLTGGILAPGIEAGVFRPVEPEAMTMLLMTIYLGTASQRNLRGKPFLDAQQVVSLILDGLRRPQEVSHDHL